MRTSVISGQHSDDEGVGVELRATQVRKALVGHIVEFGQQLIDR